MQSIRMSKVVISSSAAKRKLFQKNTVGSLEVLLCKFVFRAFLDALLNVSFEFPSDLILLNFLLFTYSLS